MHYYVTKKEKKQPMNLKLSLKEEDMIKKHFPKDLVRVNKHMQARILSKFIQ